MINIVAMALLISSLAAAGVWSPPSGGRDSHVVREGHRIIVVEYEREIPQQSESTPIPITTANVVDQVKDRFREASSVLPNAGQGISMPENMVEKPAHSARDLICDTYGSCKEKISNVLHKGKDKISRKVSDVEESAKDAMERTRDKALDIREGAKDAFERSKEKASETKENTKHTIKNAVKSVKDVAKSAAEITKEAGKDAAGNVSHTAQKTAERAVETANSIGRNLTDIVNYARNVALDTASNVVTLENVRIVAAILHLFAFAVAYGTCVWMTFVSSHVLATGLQRQQFGMVQSKLYPVYFRVVACGVGIACLGQFLEGERVVGMERVQGFNLMVALGLVLVNMMYLEPKATTAMFEMMKMEKEEGRGKDMADIIASPISTASTSMMTTATTPSATVIGVTNRAVAVDQGSVAKSRIAKLNKKLKKLNGYSSFLNILTLMCLTWHLVHLSRRLQMTSK